MKYDSPVVKYEKIKMYSLIKVNGYPAYLTGRGDNRLLLSNAIKTITIMIVGSILTVLVNIFAFGPELSVLLDRTDDKSTDLIKMIFSNDISTIIQSVGVLTIIYYVLFVSFITYAVYISANSLKIKKLSTS